MRADVVDVVRPHHDPDLAAGLHREDLLHAGLAGGDLLDPLQPLHVRLEALPAGTRPAAGAGVRGLGQHRLDRLRRDLVVVRLDRVHDVLALAVLAGQVGADQRVAALDLVGERLADVVQERARA